ncbi:AMP-binding protein [Nocardioides ferulae]|uniref:AMP-binding protein n=1 Tax=Nocardioides ferulae TaxID=2340821 RepID=UPI000EAF18F9|nr:AMP-binding protein [Nocardioides ferulae]
MLLDPAPTAGVALATRLRDFGARQALLAAEGTLTYAELADRVEARAAALGPQRRLLLLEAANDVETVVTYLAALAGGHPVLPVAAEQPDNAAALVAAWDPDVVARGAQLDEARPGTRHDLHDDLALLLSTSGSTGSPKLVRLGAEGLQANAEAIAGYLGIRDTDVAATTLPLHYCYGLSVLNSHLARGAAVWLTDASVVDPCFWDGVERHRVTTFPGVPHTFDLLDRVGFAEREIPSLRYLTQAGGRMPPETVRRYAELGQRRGFDLVVMYGQTEATARMAWLPPDQALQRAGSVGIAIPGGRFELEPVPEAPPGVGELVYSGPNVMLGYAHTGADLARGPTVDRLHTGDLARIDAYGYVEVVGRRSRVAKLFGLRLELDQVEALCEQAGRAACCIATDDALVVVTQRDPGHALPAAELAALVRRRTGLPAAAVHSLEVDDVPRLPSGKPDRPALTALAGRCLTQQAPGEETPPVPGEVTAATLRELFATLLGRPDASERDSFVSLGGDSLSYVEMSIRLEQALGRLPTGWHLLPVAELAEHAERGRGAVHPSTTGAADRAVPPRRWRTVETNVLLRALAIVAIVGTHGNLFVLTGGAHLLLGVTGFNLARFHLTPAARRERARRLVHSAARIAVPACLWIGAVTVLTGQYPWRTVLLLNGVVGPPGWSEPAWHYWFIEALVATLLLVAVLLLVPAFDRAERRWPFGLPVALALAGLLTRYEVVALRDGDVIHRASVVFWLFALGWAAARAGDPRRRLLVSALVVATVPGFFDDPQREAFVAVGLLLLLWLPHLRVPAPVAALSGTLAGASLWTYLTHWQVYPHLEDDVPLLALLLSLAVGVLASRMAGRVTAGLSRAAAGQRRRAASGGALSATSPESSTGRAPGTTLTATGVPAG